MNKISNLEIKKIKNLRVTGHSITEIIKITGRGYGTVHRYTNNIKISDKYINIIKSKQGGSKNRSIKEWDIAKNRASKIIRVLNFKEKMLILACLYWGEGNKREFNIINSDHNLLKVFVECLRSLGVLNDELKVSLRLFQDVDKKEATNFWLRELKLPNGSIEKYGFKIGKKGGKLKNGMCRIRVRKPSKYFKLIISMINLITQKV